MTLESLELIHKLLKKEFDKVEAKKRDARTAVNEAYKELEDAETDEGSTPALVSFKKTALEMCKEKEAAIIEKWNRINAALSEFESVEWR